METLERFVTWLDNIVWGGIPAGDQEIPIIVIALLGVGIFLTLRFAFVQIRHFGHGVAVTSGRYDDPNEPGDVSHFQALTTALSATVGIGNIAGVAIAIHFGGPGALFWMWMTAFLGMATKFTEVTLAQHFRQVEFRDRDPKHWEGSVSGGPMYYIERGLGPKWKWMAVLFATLLGITAFFTGNAIQANTVSDTVATEFGIATWITGLVTAAIVASVIVGGISRIGRVTAVLAPLMAAVYVLGALYVILANIGQLVPSIGLVFSEAFNPSAGIAGTGVGAFLVTMMYGVQRGLFSNEAGQGSAPIAHAAAKTDEPVSEGVVALLEPFIDTIVICTMTAMVIIMTGVWHDRIPTELTLSSGDISYRAEFEDGIYRPVAPPAEILVEDGRVTTAAGDPMLAWHEAPVEQFFVDAARTMPFTGVIRPAQRVAVGQDGTSYRSLYGDAVETGAPLTALAFRHGLPGDWGNYIVMLSVLLFAISTAISWSYYGDRCANYLFGAKAVLPYKIAFVIMHFVGAVLPLSVIWDMGDIFLGVVIFPNLFALVLLSPIVGQLLKSYFERKPWRENAEVHRRVVSEREAKRRRPE
ncbi:MAG TPA: sodium:alanine symporter family protein [Longimicrobiales bacterium]|nr:sodium:alanine symporter family protein [Longimicrobiales bacterium]